MCGLSGWLSFGRRPDPRVVAAMTGTLAHRGPDHGAVTDLGPLVLGHRRLSVIDLSAGANQPLEDVSGRFVTVFNGAIYNFRELRRTLEAEGGCFRTNGDTEVIVEAYRRWGREAVERMDGMFAFVLWDKERQELFLARDRAGEKPMVYARLADGGLIFASETKALLAHPEVQAEIAPASLGLFLSHGYVPGGSLIRGVRKLPPAHAMFASQARIEEPRPYWDLIPAFHRKRGGPYLDAAAELSSLIDETVKSRLVADVPVGAFLSGGLDSATVVGGMTAAMPAALVKTFSTGFAEDGYSEVAAARQTADHFGVAHSDREVTGDLVNDLPRIVWHADEPIADTSIVPMYYLARFAREHVTVSLSGDGGDELFAGYTTYVADRLHRILARMPGGLVGLARWIAERAVPTTFGKVSFDYKLRRFLAAHRLSDGDAHAYWRMIFDPAERTDVLRMDAHADVLAADPFEVFRVHDRAVSGLHPLDRAMYVDTKTWLADDILVKVDRTTMAHSLEARAPLLSHRLMEFAASLPPSWRLRGTTTKAILRESQRRRLPARVVAGRKLGFNAPVSHWLAGGLRAMAGDLTRSKVLDDWFDRAAIERLWTDHDARRKDNGLRLFSLTCLALWLGQVRDRTTTPVVPGVAA